MYIKRYTIGAIIYTILVGWYVYAFISQESVSINIFGINLPSLSIALWAVVPVIVLYFASVSHMFFYSILGSLKLRKYEKDYEKLLEALSDAYLAKENRHHSFKTPRYELLGNLVDNSTLFPTQNLESNTPNEKINTIIKMIEDIKNGDVVELKKLSLPTNNPLVIQNEKNRYKKGDISAEDILGSANKYDESLCKEVYVDFVKTAPLYAIEKYKNFLTLKALHEILVRINASENTLEIPNETIISFMSDVSLDRQGYLEATKLLSSTMVPEQRMKLFESLSENNEEAMDAYLFTLFDLEMLSPADEILENSQNDEFVKFKAYRALKECNKNFNINLFL